MSRVNQVLLEQARAGAALDGFEDLFATLSEAGDDEKMGVNLHALSGGRP